MKKIIAPALDEGQAYWAAKSLAEVAGIGWNSASTLVKRAPGAVFETEDNQLAEKLREALARNGIKVEIREGTPFDAEEVRRIADEERVRQEVRRTVWEPRLWVRGLSGGLALVSFLWLYLSTELLASQQETGPQLLQVYTRSAFYAVIVVGLLFSIYVLTRKVD